MCRWGFRVGMHPHAAVVTELYEGFRALDAERMAACYHPEASFSDPVFPHLQGKEVVTMWQMLTGNARDLTVTYRDVVADDTTASAHWEATYTFSRKRPPVHNRIEARFAFRDGLIVRHVDAFPFWRWSRMALGFPGLVLGWSPPVKAKVQRRAAAQLAAYPGSDRAQAER